MFGPGFGIPVRCVGLLRDEIQKPLSLYLHRNGARSRFTSVQAKVALSDKVLLLQPDLLFCILWPDRIVLVVLYEGKVPTDI